MDGADADRVHATRVRRQLFQILHKPSPDNPVARRANYVLAFLILSNALLVSLQSIPALAQQYGAAFHWFEALSTSIFVVEYLARLWVCTEQARFASPVLGRLHYAVQPLPLLDLIVIVTFWLPIDLRFLRIGRMVRLLKVLRLQHLEASLARVWEGVRRRSSLIGMAVIMMLACIYGSAALIYQLEHAVQPNVFTSIPATFWWAIETLTTIGYGDMIPKTPLGKLFAGLISVFGIGIFALPTAIVTAVIVEAGVTDPDGRLCQHCGRPPHSPWHGGE